VGGRERLESLDQLVRDAVRGDRLAFASLLETETDGAYRVALAVLRSPEDARDAVQDAAIRAWLRLPELRNGSAWPSWFRRIAVRVALDEHRRARRSREVQISNELEAGESTRMDPDNEVVAVLTAFERLSPDDRALLGLRYGADLTVPDTAIALGIPLGTAKARLHRALKRLRAELGGHDG